MPILDAPVVAPPGNDADVVPLVIAAFDAADALLDVLLLQSHRLSPRERKRVQHLVRRYQRRRDRAAMGC